MQADANAPVFATGEVEVAADPDTVWAVMADIGRWPSTPSSPLRRRGGRGRDGD